MDGMLLKHALEFKYLGCVLDESGHIQMSTVGRWPLEGGLQVLLGLWLMMGLQLDCAMVWSCMSFACACSHVWLYEALEGWKSVLWPSSQLKDIKGEKWMMFN